MKMSTREILALLSGRVSDKQFIAWLRAKVGFK